MSFERQNSTKELTTYRQLYKIDREHFKSDITDFLNSNNITNETTEDLLKQLLDKHSPLKITILLNTPTHHGMIHH